jgi:hypothetical protein
VHFESPSPTSPKNKDPLWAVVATVSAFLLGLVIGYAIGAYP